MLVNGYPAEEANAGVSRFLYRREEEIWGYLEACPRLAGGRTDLPLVRSQLRVSGRSWPPN